MKQIVHILQKDLRRFWCEIAISLALLTVFTWNWPSLWREATIEPQRTIYTLSGLSIEVVLMLLIPISWWLLVTRVVQEERLVGDRQFWITRPYEWQNLLGAKTLIIAGCIYLPLGAAQLWLLSAASLHPGSHFGAMLYDWVLLTALLILPIAALAAVTRNIARMVLTMLGVLVAAATMTAILLSLLQGGLLHSPIDNYNHLDVPLVLAFCSAVILLAYKRRRIAVARILLFVLPVLLFLSQAIFSSDAMINHHYPEVESAGIQFSLRDNAQTLESAHAAISPRQLYIQIPMNVNGIAPGDMWIGKGVRVTIEAGGRTVWSAPWQQLNFYLPTNSQTTLAFFLDREIFDRFQTEPVTLHLEIALDQAHREQVEASYISLHDVEIPGLGICSSIIAPERSEVVNGKPTPVIGGLTCRSAMRQPQLTYVETAFTRGLCHAASGDDPSPLEVQGTWIGNLNNEPAELGIAPVKVVPVPFSGNWVFHNQVGSPEFKHLCPGAPITFSRYALVRQLRMAFTIENFQFPSYDKGEDAAH